jgi:hypothetical protein
MGLIYLCHIKISPFFVRGWTELVSLPRTFFGLLPLSGIRAYFVRLRMDGLKHASCL